MNGSGNHRGTAGLSLRLAWRNIWRQKRRTWLTALAMVFSNVLLIFMISLQFGSYEMMISNTLRMFTGQVQVQREGYQQSGRMRLVIEDVSGLASQLRDRFPAASIAGRASAFVLMSSEDRSFGTQVIGVEPGFERQVSSIPGLVTEGRYLDGAGSAEIVIGQVMARNLKVAVGDEVTFLGSGRDGSFAAGVVRVVGVFSSGSQDLDRSLAEMPLGYFQDVFSMAGGGHVVVAAADSLDRAPALTRAMRDAVAEREELVVLDWDALVPGLRQAIQADLTSGWFMYGVLILLVAFSVLNTQLMSVLERTREFGVIMALGVKPRRLASLVVLETGLMASLGLLIGLLAGTAVAGYFAHVGFAYPGMEELGAKFNVPSVIYPSLEPRSIALGPCVVFLFCLLAAVYPALKLYGLRPVEAMRAA